MGQATGTLRELMNELLADDTVKLKASRIFMTLYTPNFVTDAVAALQLSAAILLDMPIYILVYQGVVIPNNLLRLAWGVEYLRDEPDAARRAGQRLMAKVEAQVEGFPKMSGGPIDA